MWIRSREPFEDFDRSMGTVCYATCSCGRPPSLRPGVGVCGKEVHWDSLLTRVVQYSVGATSVHNEVRGGEFVAEDPHFLQDVTSVGAVADAADQSEGNSGAPRCSCERVGNRTAAAQSDVRDDVDPVGSARAYWPVPGGRPPAGGVLQTPARCGRSFVHCV